MGKATAVANPNIAFIKYWGKANEDLNLPANPSVSMNLGALTTVTSVEFRSRWAADSVTIDGQPASGQALRRVIAHLDRVRRLAGISDRAMVASQSDYPAGTGLASSAAAFAALSLAATRAVGHTLDEAGLSRLARLGSGSACRSVPAGFCLWEGSSDATSFAHQIATPEHWGIRDVIAIVARQPKAVSSYDGHALAPSSPLWQARLAAVPALLAQALDAIQERDLDRLGRVTEADALAMHAVMMTSAPALQYWLPPTAEVLQAVLACRREGLGVYFTLDAGPNVHCLCEADAAPRVRERLEATPGVQEVVVSAPGNGARLVDYHLF